MVSTRPASILWMLTGILVVVGSLGSAAESNPEFAAAKQTFLKEMRRKAPAARIDALTSLARFPLPESADLLVKRGLTDDDPSVQLAAKKALRIVAQDAVTAKHLMDELKRTVKKQATLELTSGILGALVTSVPERMQAEMAKLVDDLVENSNIHLLVPMTAIDDLGKEGGAVACQGITVLAKAKPFETQFGYRRCVVQGMSQLREPAAIGFLIEMLPNTKGLIQADIIQHLTKVTLQKFRDNDRDWTNWWKENEAKFKFPAIPLNANPAPDVVDEKQPTYYGIPICAKRVVFVLDTSRSMNGPPMDAAKMALVKTVESLPEAVNFDIITFDRVPVAWLPRLVPATYQAKVEASQAVIARDMGLGTASNAALTAAFGLEPEVIYFLSDGEPTDGAPAQIVANIASLNRTRRVSIHTIGVVTQRGGGIGLTLFMQPLAQQNYGSFRLIE